MRANDDGKTVAAMDVLVPGIGELVGGSQREERLDRCCSRNARNLTFPKTTFGGTSIPEGSARLPMPGLDWASSGLVMFATGMTNIRDVIPFPRTPLNAEF